MKRLAPYAVAAAAFALAFALAHGRFDEDAPSPTVGGPDTVAGGTAAPTLTAPKSQLSPPRAAGSMAPIPVAQLSDWQRRLLAEPVGAGHLQSAVRRAMSLSRRDQPVRPIDCLREAGLIGRFMLRFQLEVRATPTRVEMAELRFAEIEDGQPLGADTIDCLVSRWPLPDPIEAQPPIEFLDYEGPIDVRLAARLGDPEDLPERSYD